MIVDYCDLLLFSYVYFFFFKQKTAYEMRISDWSSDVCSSDLIAVRGFGHVAIARDVEAVGAAAAIISVVETGIGAHRAQPRHVIEQIAPDRIRTVGEPAGKRLRHRKIGRAHV